eukprot:scaffold367637_cov20-Prasinocladus_malaysianus.AAC.1
MGSQQHRELCGDRCESRNAVTRISKSGKQSGSGWAESLASPFLCCLALKGFQIPASLRQTGTRSSTGTTGSKR